MKRIVLALVLIACALPMDAQEATQEAADPWEALAAYEYGDSRAPLTAIENEVVASMKSPAERTALAARLADMLDDDTSYNAKLFICRQLMKIGSENEVPALALLLTDEKLTDPARYALERIPGDTATQALIDALDEAEGEVLIGIIAGLGLRGENAGAEAVAPYVLAENQPVAEAALGALGAIGSEPAIKAMVAAFDEAGADELPPELQVEAEHVLLKFAASALKQGNKNDARRLLSGLQEPGASGNPTVRAAAFLALARMDGGAAMDRVIAALDADDPAIAEAATRLLYELPGDDLAKQLAQAVAGMPSAMQTRVIPVLAARGGAAARDAVDALLDSEDEAVRTAAVKAIAKMGDASSVMRLATLASEWSGRERVELRKAFVALPGADVDATILRNLDGAQPAVQEELIRVAADRGLKDAVPQLIALTGDENAEVRKRAFKALGELAESGDMPELLALIGTVKNADDLPLLEAAIIDVAEKPGETAGAGDQLLASLDATGDAAVEAAILRIMGELGTEDAFPVVQKHLDNPELAVRMAALTALTKLDAPGVRAELKRVYQAAENAEQRVLALEGYVRLLAQPGAESPEDAAARFQELIEDAADADELEAVIRGLGDFHRGAALDMAVAHLGHETADSAAVSSVVNLAPVLINAYPEKTDAAIRKLVELRDNKTMHSWAKDVRALRERVGHFIAAWEYAGPYMVEGQDHDAVFKKAFPPETGADEVPWQVYPANLVPNTPWKVDFEQLLGGENRCAYLRTTVVAPEAMEATGLAGSDDGIKVWVNGKEVHGKNAIRGLTKDEGKFPLSLKAGENTLLVKVIQAGGSWSACMRLVDADNAPLDELKYKID